MTNEEAIEILSGDRNNISVGAWKIAVVMAIESIENQPKYEWALEMAVRDSDKSGTDIWCHDCPYDDDSRLEHCWECGMKYYRRKAGIDDGIRTVLCKIV